MVQIILLIDGWKKEIEVHEVVVRIGHVNITLMTPVNYLLNGTDACDEKETIVEFVFRGTRINNKPVFEYVI